MKKGQMRLLLAQNKKHCVDQVKELGVLVGDCLVYLAKCVGRRVLAGRKLELEQSSAISEPSDRYDEEVTVGHNHRKVVGEHHFAQVVGPAADHQLRPDFEDEEQP